VSHVDLLRFDDGIIIVSLLSSCVMTMRPANHNDKQSEGSVRRDILLRPGDILALSGEARYHWKHGIEERLIDEIDGETIERGTRISVTLRRLKEQEE
jgi:alkylated DNA repair dioxygenase AlkB